MTAWFKVAELVGQITFIGFAPHTVSSDISSLQQEMQSKDESPGLSFLKILFFLFSKIFKLEGNCFTMLCWFLPYNSGNQL